MGRPTKLDDDAAKRICQAVANGNTRKNAALVAGVSITAFKEWMQRGRRGEEPYAAFAASVKRADARARLDAIEVIRTAATSGQWQAAAWWLERTDPQHYGRRERIDARVKVDDVSKLSTAEIEARLGILERMRGEE